MKLNQILSESVTFYVDGQMTNDSDSGETPEFTVANTSARLILRMLGVTPDDDDLCGRIPLDELPKIRQKLIKLKNSNIGQYQRPATDTREKRISTDGNVTSLYGPRVIDSGVDEDRIARYIDSMLDIIVAAQKLNRSIIYA